MDGTHSVRTSATQASASLSGRYFSLFGNPNPQPLHSDEALQKLAAQMVLLPAKVEDDAEDSIVPAGYTYFAQFVAHDLTFEPATSHQRELDPRCELDYRTPRFDLDGLYGRGPDDQPYMYRDRARFLLGAALLDTPARDLPRTAQHMALVGDPRNDQNAILSQIHGLFLRLHNRLVDVHGGSFEDAQQSLRHHYQYVVLNDLLPRLVGSELLQEFVERAGTTYRLKGLAAYARAVEDPALPVEFSAAAGRFGHSMVRPSYQLNRALSFATMSTDEHSSLVAFVKPLSGSWGIEWDLFVEPLVPTPRPRRRDKLQMAYKIDACLAEPLTNLPSMIVNLAERNLKRGRAHNLASGQTVARLMGLQPLPDEQLRIGDVTRNKDVAIAECDPSFAGNAPLWVYILAEAHAARLSDAGKPAVAGSHPRQLGDVGGRIVTETYLALLAADTTSILNCPFQPSLGDRSKPFDLAALIAAALESP